MSEQTPATPEPVDINQAHEFIGLIADALWNKGKRTKSGHLWSIPADRTRDWDFVFSAALDELASLRTERDRLSTLNAELCAALQELVVLSTRDGSLCEWRDTLLVARTALAKAEGEVRRG